MNFFGHLFNYLFHGSAITVIVLLGLFTYFILTLWVFYYRYEMLKSRIELESSSLKFLYMGKIDTVSRDSILHNYLRRSAKPNREIMNAAISDVVRSSTKGLTLLSIASSTSPFIGLFGTVIGILETFATLGGQKTASLGVVAPAISEALVATAAGIFVAIFAYSFHIILKRKAYELGSILQSQSDIILAKNNEAN